MKTQRRNPHINGDGVKKQGLRRLCQDRPLHQDLFGLGSGGGLLNNHPQQSRDTELPQTGSQFMLVPLATSPRGDGGHGQVSVVAEDPLRHCQSLQDSRVAENVENSVRN